jgi:hypothetical protein
MAGTGRVYSINMAGFHALTAFETLVPKPETVIWVIRSIQVSAKVTTFDHLRLTVFPTGQTFYHAHSDGDSPLKTEHYWNEDMRHVIGKRGFFDEGGFVIQIDGGISDGWDVSVSGYELLNPD